MENEVYYFGDGRLRDGPGAGHHIWAPSNGHVAWAHAAALRKLPWSLAELDGSLAGDPALADRHDPRHWATENQPEGLVRLHHRGGWTAISFWDRSGDSRYGSSSTLVASGTHTAREMVALLQRAFPAIWERITRRFELVLPVEAPRPEPAPRLRVAIPALRVAAVVPERLEIAELAAEADVVPDGASGRRVAVIGGERRGG
ncbi:hypothetical protein [Sorangium sp. So ce388]|uniref:hypothetical protein n=1 Tax=Sorangium sp. So ce388 TaxID=3133309 RepID=UPI003F5B5EBA